VDRSAYSVEVLRREAENFLAVVRGCPNLEVARDRLRDRVSQIDFDVLCGSANPASHELIRVRDCAAALGRVLTTRSDARSGFSVAGALWDIARGEARPDLGPGFCAELIHWIQGLEGRATFQFAGNKVLSADIERRRAARLRSDELDRLWGIAEEKMGRFADGLTEESSARREGRKAQVLEALGGCEADWLDWKWHLRHLITDAPTLARAVRLSPGELAGVEEARAAGLPFAVTPHYAALMDDDGEGRDRAVRAQVLPSQDYVDCMTALRGDDRAQSCDFMLEGSTSPIELVTRRYPAIVILKPFNTCPQICVYCQRNWEIDQAMAPGALASPKKIEAAMAWIEDHPSIREVLVTGGDPFALGDSRLEQLMTRLASIPSVDMIRIGTRTPVTLPMRITDELAALLGRYRELGRRAVAVVTHIEHPYEITMDTARAVDRLRRQGLSVYNQLVYTFYVSRRFEGSMLRMLLRRIGVEPYYTFAPKGKQETARYRVPLARLLQEQKEEARLMPGSRRTDEAVYNVPGLGKNYLRARQHRNLLSVLPDGARVYEFHPWEKNVIEQDAHVATDVPILEYLQRLEEIGESADDYESIWYYF
jgi:lysine 2,3-aminomutase